MRRTRLMQSGMAMMMVLGLSWEGAVWADPIVSIDVDPSTSGVQNALTVNLNDVVTVDVVITNLSGPTIERVEFDVDFDSSVLTATSVALGGFLTGGAVTILENDVSPPDVNFTVVGGLGVGNDSNQALASITFMAIGAGTTLLDLNDVVLSDRDGLFVFPQASSPVDGTMTVSAIPEPSTLLLFGSGLVGLGLYRWWRSGASQDSRSTTRA